MAERILFRAVCGFDHGRVTQARAVQDSTSFVVLLLYAVVRGIMFIQPRADSSRTMCTVVVCVFVTVQHSVASCFVCSHLLYVRVSQCWASLVTVPCCEASRPYSL